MQHYEENEWIKIFMRNYLRDYKILKEMEVTYEDMGEFIENESSIDLIKDFYKLTRTLKLAQERLSKIFDILHSDAHFIK